MKYFKMELLIHGNYEVQRTSMTYDKTWWDNQVNE